MGWLTFSIKMINHPMQNLTMCLFYHHPATIVDVDTLSWAIHTLTLEVVINFV